uniref:Uncharacterized protein n=1 Tax=Manihot esculenta TaxID=3983 RepID=A0A251KM24_MANES
MMRAEAEITWEIEAFLVFEMGILFKQMGLILGLFESSWAGWTGSSISAVQSLQNIAFLFFFLGFW